MLTLHFWEAWTTIATVTKFVSMLLLWEVIFLTSELLCYWIASLIAGLNARVSTLLFWGRDLSAWNSV
jgi:hypothetical protein